MASNTVATPNFLVAGAAKSGTTSLCHYLRQHPDIYVARRKESHYFAFPGARPRFTGPGEASEFLPLIVTDLPQYLECFASARNETAVGEASVYYNLVPEAFERALEFDKAMRFVIILREPLGRAYSAWSHQARDGWETLDFRAALQAEDSRVAEGYGYGWQYQRVSRYTEQLTAIKALVPADQLHLMLYEDLHSDPGPTMQAAYEFLGVDRGFVPDTSLVLNASGAPKSAALNGLLARQNRTKEALKKVVPYRLGLRVSQQLRNWNLSGTPLSEGDRNELAPLFAFDQVELEHASGLDLTVWSESAAL